MKVINTHGEQVVDTWAFVRHDLREFMSMEHTRATLVKIMPAVGDCLYTTRRRPILKILEDTSPGVHDTLMAACDSHRYGLLGCTGYHDNCTDNLWAAMHALGLTPPETPSPLNLFMNIPWRSGGELSFDPPVTRPGDYIVLEAQLDLVVAFSACPQDILPINGAAGRPTRGPFPDIRFRPRRKAPDPGTSCAGGNDMSAYIIAEIEVIDSGKFEEYRKLVPPTLEAFGGRYVVRGGRRRLPGGRLAAEADGRDRVRRHGARESVARVRPSTLRPERCAKRPPTPG